MTPEQIDAHREETAGSAATWGSRKAHRAATAPQAALKARRRGGPDARKG
jgi:hypothetical protein